MSARTKVELFNLALGSVGETPILKGRKALAA
jgi:hypothetical protein